MKYIATVESGSTHPREYETNSRNALVLAAKYGRCEGGESVTVYTKAGKAVSRALWSPEDGGHYYRVTV